MEKKLLHKKQNLEFDSWSDILDKLVEVLDADNPTVEHMDLVEFREKGYLQEANRRFFHPLGLALEIVLSGDERKGYFLRVQDFRNNPEGVCYNIKNSNQERKERFRKNKEYINKQFKKYSKPRLKLIGSVIEKIPN